MMRRLSARSRLLPLLAFALAIQACDGENDLLGACNPGEIVDRLPALVVEVTDSLTGAARAHQATGWAVGGRTTIPVVQLPEDVVDASRLYGNVGPGTYTVLVARAGYAPWGVSGVRVEDGGCMPRPVTLQARLQPLPGEVR